jgi:opacity protein-like surface antigen
LALVFSFIASAQSAPRADIFGGYTYNRVSGFTIPFQALFNTQGPAFPVPAYGLNGYTGSVNVRAYRWLGVTAEITDLYGTPLKKVLSTGPRVSVSFRHERWTPFLQALYGEAHGTALVTVPGEAGSFYISERKFAVAIGGGLDLKLKKHVAVRLAQAEYAVTHFESSQQKNLRISTGFVFRF